MRLTRVRTRASRSLRPEQIVLGLGGAVLDGVEQRGIHTGQPRQHLGVPLVALAFGARDGVELARVGDQTVAPSSVQETADPRAVGASFQRHRGVRELGHQLGQRRPGVGQRAVTDDLAGGIQDAYVMASVTEIKAEGEPAGNNGAGRG